MDSKAKFNQFRSVRALVSWICHSCPDVCCVANWASQVLDGKVSLRHVKDLNKAIKKLKRTSDISLKYRMLDINSKHMRV